VEAISEAMMIKIVLEDLRSNNERTLEQAMDRLKKYLLYEEDANRAEKQEAFVQVGGHAFIVRVMKEHPNSKILQFQCIQVLVVTMYKNASTQTAVAKVEGIQAILAAMKRFPSVQAVIHIGFGALSNIIHTHETNANVLVTKRGGIPLLIKRMKEFQADVNVTEVACIVLKHLSGYMQVRKPIVDAKAVTALGYAIEGHGDNPKIQKVRSRGDERVDVRFGLIA
jgi:hypothetical protein